MQKTTVSSARNVGFSVKKRQFLKLIPIFVGIKNTYCSDYQYLSSNAENKRFLPPNDNALANIGCMHAYNMRFVNFIRIYRRGVIYHVPPVVLDSFHGFGAIICFYEGRRNVTNHTLMTDALVFRSRQNEINHTSTAGAFRLFYAIIIPAEVRNGKEHTKLSLNKGIATPDDNSGCLYVVFILTNMVFITKRM